MKVLIVGGGGREHALAWKFKQSEPNVVLYIAPGNAGTAQLGTNISLDPLDFEGIKTRVLEKQIDLVVVGPEEPLVRGITDFFFNDDQLKDIPLLGPTREGALLEGSKSFAKEFMQRHKIPTAAYAEFTADQYENALDYIGKGKFPVVVKADGLAAGKGVRVCYNYAEAEEHLGLAMKEDAFGEGGHKVIIEEFLDGIELSVFVLTDGNTYIMLPEAKDYKRAGEEDTGPNTGGMGAVSPVPFAGPELMERVKKRVIEPTIEGLKQEGITYRGFVYFGLMIVNMHDPYVIEYNVRMGDPETEVVLPRVQGNFLQAVYQAAKGNLDGIQLDIDSRYCVTVMLVSGGYPGQYLKGKVITGLESTREALVFHAGTSCFEGKIITSGGRVIAVSCLSPSMETARAKSYHTAGRIDFMGKNYRVDIGSDLIKFTR